MSRKISSPSRRYLSTRNQRLVARAVEARDFVVLGSEDAAASGKPRLRPPPLELPGGLRRRDRVNPLFAIALERGSAPEDVGRREDDQCHAGPEHDHEASTP